LSGVRAPDHDISLPLEDQLVRELESWVLGVERLDVLPSCRSCRLALPFHQDLAHPVSQAVMHNTCRLRNNRAMMQGRQGQWISRRRSLELLEQSHMKHVMDAGSGWQGQSNRDFIDKLVVDILGKRRRRALSEAK
jgi:hypothetical protein